MRRLPKTSNRFMRSNEEVWAGSEATPDHWHASITMAAMDRGLDVYCEKPMTRTLEEAKQVVDKAKATNRLRQVGVQPTSWDRWHKVRELLRSGIIGEVVAAQGTYSRNDPKGDWNWPIDPDAGPGAAGENLCLSEMSCCYGINHSLERSLTTLRGRYERYGDNSVRTHRENRDADLEARFCFGQFSACERISRIRELPRNAASNAPKPADAEMIS
jgi:hypothetical protein